MDTLLPVIAVSPSDAWVGGGVAPNHLDPGRPVAEHWNGRRWSTSRLPTGLSGAIEALSASAWNDVWAFGATFHGAGGFALRFDGHHWHVMKRWPGTTSVAGAVVRSPDDVWVFSAVTGIVQHFDGHRWRGIRVVPNVSWFDSARMLPDGQVWAIANLAGPDIVTGTPGPHGYTWTGTVLTGFPAGRGGDVLADIDPISPTDVWAFGGNVKTVRGHDHWYPVAAHWDGVTWQRVQVSGSFTLTGGTSASDGHGGQWVTTGWDSTGIPPHLLHFTGGRFLAVDLPRRGGRYVGVFGLANIPRSAAVWGTGALTGLGSLGPTTGLILRHS